MNLMEVSPLVIKDKTITTQEAERRVSGLLELYSIEKDIDKKQHNVTVQTLKRYDEEANFKGFLRSLVFMLVLCPVISTPILLYEYIGWLTAFITTIGTFTIAGLYSLVYLGKILSGAAAINMFSSLLYYRRVYDNDLYHLSEREKILFKEIMDIYKESDNA